MIASIKGQILYTDEKSVVIETSGIGYKVFVSSGTLASIHTGDTVSLLTHLVHREDAMDLYGFLDKKEKAVFELLISISGIGPKSALNILSTVTSDTLTQAIRSGSTAHLIKVSGIGRKTAEKIVLELKDKLGTYSDYENDNISKSMSSDSDVIEALRALGYDTNEARDALKKIDKEIKDTGAKIKAVLKALS